MATTINQQRVLSQLLATAPKSAGEGGPARPVLEQFLYAVCREVVAGRGSFLDLLADHPEIKPHMSRDKLAALVDPANYLGLAGEMVDRVLAQRPPA